MLFVSDKIAVFSYCMRNEKNGKTSEKNVEHLQKRPNIQRNNTFFNFQFHYNNSLIRIFFHRCEHIRYLLFLLRNVQLCICANLSQFTALYFMIAVDSRLLILSVGYHDSVVTYKCNVLFCLGCKSCVNYFSYADYVLLDCFSY